jgi:hypothetical protein
VAQIKLIARTALPDFMMFSPDELNSRCAPYLFIQNMSRNFVLWVERGIVSPLSAAKCPRPFFSKAWGRKAWGQRDVFSHPAVIPVRQMSRFYMPRASSLSDPDYQVSLTNTAYRHLTAVQWHCYF